MCKCTPCVCPYGGQSRAPQVPRPDAASSCGALRRPGAADTRGVLHGPPGKRSVPTPPPDAAFLHDPPAGLSHRYSGVPLVRHQLRLPEA